MPGLKRGLRHDLPMELTCISLLIDFLKPARLAEAAEQVEIRTDH